MYRVIPDRKYCVLSLILIKFLLSSTYKSMLTNNTYCYLLSDILALDILPLNIIVLDILTLDFLGIIF